MSFKFIRLMQLINDWQNITYLNIRALLITRADKIQFKQLGIFILEL